MAFDLSGMYTESGAPTGKAAQGSGFLDTITGSMAQDPLAWTKLGLGVAGGTGSGIEAYLSYKERKRAQKLQEELARNADRRAERSLDQQIKAYDEGATQRGANTLATMAPVLSQAQTLRDRLRLLGGRA